MYLSQSADLSLSYARGQLKVLLVRVLIGRAVSVTGGVQLRSRLPPGVHAHIVGDYQEVVIPHAAQLLPCYVLHLQGSAAATAAAQAAAATGAAAAAPDTHATAPPAAAVLAHAAATAHGGRGGGGGRRPKREREKRPRFATWGNLADKAAALGPPPAKPPPPPAPAQPFWMRDALAGDERADGGFDPAKVDNASGMVVKRLRKPGAA